MCGPSLVQKHSEVQRPACLAAYRYLWREKSRKSEHDYKKAWDEQNNKTNSTGST